MLERSTNRDAQGDVGKRLARGGLWVLMNRVLVAVTQIVTLALLARLLSPEEMGVYFLVSNFVIIGSVLAQLGIPQVVIKQIAESVETGTSEQTRAVILSGLLIGLASAVVFFGLLYFVLGDWIALTMFRSPLMAQVMLFAVLWLAVQALQRVVGESFRGLHDMRMAAIFGGMFSGVVSTGALLLLWLLFGTLTLNEVVLVLLVSMVLSLAAALLVLHKKAGLTAPHAGLDLKPMLVLAFPILFASLGNIALSRADIWLLGIYVDETDLALYGSAARLIGLLSTPLLLASAVLAPMIVQLNKMNEKDTLQRIVQLVPTLVAVPALMAIAIFVGAGDWVLKLLYGDEFYAGAWTVLNLLAAGQVFALLAGVSIQILLMTAGQALVMGITLLATLMAIVLSVILVKSHGIEGVAFAFAAAIAFQSLASLIACRVKLGLKTHLSLIALLNAKKTMKQMRATRQEAMQARAAGSEGKASS